MRIDVGVLGPIQAARDGQVIDVGGPQRRRLLAFLCCDPGHVVPVERVVSAMWPDDRAPDGADRTVMTYVSRLRGAVAPAIITSRGVGYVVDPEQVELDSRRFEALARQAATAELERVVAILDEALGVWRGAAFGEFAGEWWARPEAARLEELRVVAAEDRAEALLVLGRHGVAVSDLEALAALHPLRERPVGMLMRGLRASGRSAEALRAYQRYRRRLAEETGLDPSPELVALDRAIARGEVPVSGEVVGRALRGYVLADVLGEGTSARVYAATQPGTGRAVAVKVVRAELADAPDFVRHFEAEARAVARLEHPHVVPLYDYWREPGGAYLVFRLMRGGTLAASLAAGGRWSLSRASRLVEEVGAALIAAHSAGVVHGDIKASNVLLDDDGNTYLGDFGVAVVDGRPDGAPPGDAPHDVEAFAVLVWELLMGRPPVTRQRYLAAAVGSRRSLPPLVGQVDGLPEAVDAVLARATAGDTGARFESMAELVVAWRTAVGRPEGVLTPLGGPGYPMSSSSRRLAARHLTEQVAAGSNPFAGLRHFDEADAERFFGRDRVADALRATVDRERFVAVVGPSGSGKTSLVRAGLIPRLRRDGWVVASMVPGERPAAALREAVVEIAVDPLTDGDPAALILASARAAPGKLVLVVDQLEECWTVSPPRARDEFLAALAIVAAAEDVDVCVVAAVRADFYDRPLQDPVIGPLFGKGTFPLAPMRLEELEEAISLPVERTGVVFDQGVVAALVADSTKQAAPLPLLQFTLAELYERRSEGRIPAAALAAVGSIGGAVAARASALYESLGGDSQTAARVLFRRLVAPGGVGAGMRRRARVSELTGAGRDVAERYVAARLLVGDRDPASREPVVEIAHEALLAQWPLLGEWLEADRLWIAQLQHLATSARAWDDVGRPDSDLYRGSRLEAAIEALPEHGAELAPVEASFVDAGRAARDAALDGERRSTRRLRRLLVAAGLALVLALVAGGVAMVQRARSRDAARAAEAARAETAEQRDQARIDRLVAESERLLPGHLDLAGLLAVEARRRRDTSDTRGALLTALTYTMPTSTTADIPSRFLGYIQPPDGVGDGGAVLDLSDDGTTLAVSSWNPRASQVTVYDVRTRTVLAHAEAPLLVRDLDLSADGRRVVGLIEHVGDSLSRDRLLVLDVATGATSGVDLARADGGTLAPRIRLTPDGASAIVLGHDGALTAWDLTTLLPAAMPLPAGPLDWFDLAKDGTLVTVGRDLTVSWFDLVTGSPVRSQAVAAVGSDLSDALHAVSPDGRTLAIGEWQGPLFLWDLTTGSPIPDQGGRPDGVRNVAFDPVDPAVLAVTTTTGAVAFFDVTSNAVIGEPARVHGNGMRSISFSASGRALAAFADDRRISLWGDGNSPGLIDSPFSADPDLDHAVFSPDRSHVLLFGDRAELRRVEDPSAPGVAMSPPAGSGDTGYYLAAFDGNGTRVLLGPTDIPGYVADAATGQAVWSAPPEAGLLRDISPDGSIVVADRDGTTIELWDVDADRQIASARLVDLGIDAGISTTIAFSSDGQYVDLVTDVGTVRLRVPSLEAVSVIDSRRAQCTVTHLFPSDLLVSMDGPGRVSLFDMAAGRLARTGVSRDSTSICGVGASADGSLIAAHHTFTNQVALFDAASMRPLGAPIPVGAGNGWLSPAFADATHMVDVGAAGGLSTYNLDPNAWQANVCQQAGRNLSAPEWREYIGVDEPYRPTCPQWPAGA